MIQMLFFLACGEKPVDIVIDTAEDTGSVEEPSTEPSTEDTGTDQDGDGFTVEDGDCDDTSPWINPARSEEPGDGVDNDCDGRIDEKWSGVTVSLVKEGQTSSLLTLNQIGNVDSELALSNDCMPTYLDHDPSQIGGFVISHANSALAKVASDGTCTVLVDYSEEDNTELLGVIGQEDGSVLASRGNELIRVGTDGTVTSLADWNASILAEDGSANPDFQLYVWSIAQNIVTKEVALFGLFGGFATWSTESGLVVHRSIDADTWDGRYAYAGAVRDGGGWYTLLYNGDSGEISVANFDMAGLDWNTRIVWTEADQSAQEFAFPQGITVNGDNGDYYVTADVASFSSVFRIREVDQFIDDLYRSGSEPSWTFFGIVSNY
jgi:hypothetical protein